MVAENLWTVGDVGRENLAATDGIDVPHVEVVAGTEIKLIGKNLKSIFCRQLRCVAQDRIVEVERKRSFRNRPLGVHDWVELQVKLLKVHVYGGTGYEG